MKVNIGKNTLGDTDKMSVNMREYGRSTHNLSYAWRSTMGVGSLVPFMSILALPGDTFEIDLENKILTNPTIGPLFGSFKFQADVFTCPIRLYNAMLHNNALNVGLDMKKVKLPKTMGVNENINKEGRELGVISNSSLYTYFQIREGKRVKQNAVPILAYYDIFKNYYANKQEKKFPMYAGVQSGLQGTIESAKLVSEAAQYTEKIVGTGIKSREQFDKTKFQFLDSTGHKYNIEGVYLEGSFEKEKDNDKWIFRSLYGKGDPNKFDIGRLAEGNKDKIEIVDGGNIQNPIKQDSPNALIVNQAESVRKIELFELEEIDNLRELILSKGKQEFVFGNSENKTNIGFLDIAASTKTQSEKLGGLCIKTYQSDVFTNWINSEWVEGDNGIAKVTAVDVSSGSFTIDTLNLAKKVYEMLNRIAISGGSYKDWIEAVYTTDYYFRTETPIYEGGMSSEIEFQEIVSNSASETDGYEPLGTLAGRGVNTNKKGGSITIKINEPSYIIGICSITPRVDYSQGNTWDAYLDTLNDIHKPQLDGIGYQDLDARTLDWRAEKGVSIGKQPAWINYTTNFNKTFGEFAVGESMDYMVLNRPVKISGREVIYGASSYIEPERYNNIFATTGTQEQNFQIQIGARIEARRVMSARQIPNF